VRREYVVIILIIGVTILSFLIFVSKKSIRKAFLAALVAQEITWPIGLLLTSFGKVEYPVRLFPKAIDSSFLHGFILNPIIYAIYYVHYPKKAKLIWKWVYTLIITAIPASIESIENNYTKLIHYKTWSGYYSWMILLLSYFFIRKYLDWFFKNVTKQGGQKSEG
jgi:hypothetical protein